MEPQAGPSRPKISFGGLKKGLPSVGGGGQSVGAKRTAIQSRPFDDSNDDDDDDLVVAKPTSHVRIGSAPISRAAKYRQDEALAEDASVFDYDGVFDSMKAAERASRTARDVDRQTRDPKYMQASLAASEQRKLDRTRAEARKIQREREQEGDAYDDRESFVTEAYKRQMDELKEDEERERVKEEKDRRTSKGVAGFYKNMLAEQDRTHQAAVEATTNAGGGRSSTAAAANNEDEGEPSEEHRKRQRIDEARQKGLDVRLNDENDVVDERSLLSAGLNTFTKRRRKQSESDTRAVIDDETFESHHGHGSAAAAQRSARDAQRVRQSKLIEEQMLALQRKRDEDERAEAQAHRQRATSARRNDDKRIEQARQRAMERRKQREEKETTTTTTT